MSSTAATLTGNGLASFEKELICSICTEVLYQPLTILNCLHTFCGSCLKEWFSHQHRKASSSRSSSSAAANPYSCPTCRAEVIDVQHNATVSNLLELFLAANPSRDRTQEDKDDMDGIYKPDGTRPRDKVLPRVDRRRERRNRRDDSEATRERQLIEEARQRSLADLDGTLAASTLAPPRSDRARSTSAEREERRQRRRERERQRAQESHLTIPSATARRESEDDHAASSPSASSPRHPDAVEARQREQRMSHQASLRSLVSASESGTGTGDSFDEARIMQEILEEGMLGDIDVDALNEEEQDRLAERIAELYRQRHSRRSFYGSLNQASSRPTSSSSPESHQRHHPPRPEHQDRPSSAQPPATDHVAGLPVAPRARSNSARPQPMPPTSIARSNSQGSSSVTIHHRRRTSDQTQQGRAAGRSRQSSMERPRPSSSSANLIDGRDRRLSGITARKNTDPTILSSPRASDTWLQAGGDDRRFQLRNGVSPSRSPRYTQTMPISTPAGSIAHEDAPSPGFAELDGPAMQPVVRYEEPAISCFRCQKPDIQYEIYRHCRPCKLDLCMRCYREAKGCKHWYGFGHAADVNFENAKGSDETTEPPHVLIGRQYQKPAALTVLETRNSSRHSQPHPKTTTSNPADRLQEGHFCDRCGIFANSQFWLCDSCNDGEWGFCKQCVQTHHCCTHPLLPVAYVPQTQSAHALTTGLASVNLSLDTPHPPQTSTHSRPTTPNSPTSHHRRASGYDYLSINVNCDMCHSIIFPSYPRYHCPFHQTDYDICISCYASFLAQCRSHSQPRSSSNNADIIAGWRKCPSGHRMIILCFETDPVDNSVRRVVHADLVGGWKMNDADQQRWNQQHCLSSPPTSPPPVLAPSAMGNHGTWSWREDATGTKRGSKNRASTPSDAGSASRFPPDGGFGKKGVVYYAYWPEEGADGEGELRLPRGAEVSEMEDVNGDWWSGVYAGDVGVLPFGYAR